MKKIAYDGMQVDSLQIVEDSRCCLKVNAVLTKEGVYQYPDGKALKSRMELLKATHTARNAKITILDHPDSMVIMSQNQIHGTVEKPYFDRDKIRAVLSFDKSTTPKTFLDEVRMGKLKDVSIGFYYQPDATPGKWNDKPYDYIMRDIVIDHVAAGVLKGRCSFPDCGIGVDAMMRRIALDPFGGYEDFEDCVAKNSDKGDPEAYCAAIKRAIEGSSNKGDKTDMSEKERMQHEKEIFIADKVKNGLTQEQAEQQFNELTKPPEQPQSTPPPQAPPQTPPPTTPPPTVPPHEPTAEELITRSEQLGKRAEQLLQLYEQQKIEDQKRGRRHLI